MSSNYMRLAIASAVALIVGLLAGFGAGLAFSISRVGPLEGTFLDWRIGWLLMVFGGYNFILGLVPGPIAHIVLVRMKLTGIIPYLVSAALIGVIWCIALALPTTLQVYAVTCALVGTTAFWLVRRPDRLSSASVSSQSSSVA